jgi:type VI secretion system Hcp family effector
MNKCIPGPLPIRIALSMIALLAVGWGQAQQQIKLTSSKDNNFCNGSCTLLSAPDLNGNPNAVIFVTQVAVNGANPDPHPICAYYNGKQWSVMNVDNSVMPSGAQFTVQYYAAPDDNHFVHVVTKDNLVKSNSYLDHRGLNGNANAKFQSFQNASPNVRGGQVNKDDVAFKYDNTAGQWYVYDVKGKILDNATGYNISITPDLSFSTMPAPISQIPLTAAPMATAPVTAAPAATGTTVGTVSQIAITSRVLLTVIGSTQGQFTGTLTGNKIDVAGFDLAVNTLTNTNGNTGQAISIHQYSPIMIRKNSDDGSLQFLKALTSNELLTKLTLEFYKTTSTGAGALDYSIVLGNASVSNFKQSYNKADLTKPGMVDSISIVFQTISFVMGASTAPMVMDNWVK